MKKLVTYAIVFALFIGIPACCPGFYVIRGIQQVELFNWDEFSRLDDNTFSGDTLVMDVRFETELFTDGMIEGTMSSMWAFSCDRPTANKVIDLDITSSEVFNGIPVGQSLKPQLLFTSFIGGPLLTNDELVLSIEPDFGLSNILFVFPEKPNIKSHQFNLIATDDSGNEMKYTTETIIWE